VESDLTFAPGGGWVVRSGGSLLVRVVERPLVWTMPGGSIADGGELFCESGSTCQFLGGYRSYGRFPPTIESSQAASPGRYFRAGAALLCPHVDAAAGVEPRCGATPGNERLVRLRTPAASDPFFAESLGAVGPDELVCIFDPDPTDAMASPDLNYCYWITGVEVAPSAGDPFLEFDVTQQSRNDPSDNAAVAPVALRETRECVLQADVAAGARTVPCAPDFISADGERAGQWLWVQEGTETCGDGDATPCRLDPVPYRIARTRDGGAGPDELELLDVRGIAHPLPNACDAGPATCRGFVTAAAWLEGDPLSIWVPVILRSATTGRTRKVDEDDSTAKFSGTLELRSVVFDGTGRVNQEGDLALLGWDDVALFDVAASANAKLRVFTEPRGQTAVFGHTMIAGTSRCSEGDTIRSGCPQAGLGTLLGETCVVAEADGTGHATFRDLALRHCGADGLGLAVDGATFAVERLRSQFRGATPGRFLVCQGSCQVLDAECIDCANQHVIYGPGDWDVDDLVVVGGRAALAIGSASGSERLRRATVAGVTTNVSTGFVHALDELEGFVLRDVVAGPGQRLVDTSAAPGPYLLRDGWIVDSRGSASALLNLGYDTTLEHVAIVDTDRSSGPCTVVARGAGAGRLTLRNLLLGWRFGSVAQCNLGLVATLGAGQTAEYADLLVANFSGTALGGSNAESVTWLGDLCAANDAVELGAAVEQDFAAMDPAALPEIVRGDFTAGEWPVVTCGLAREAGVSTPGWTHAMNRIEPEFVDPTLVASLLPVACGDGVDNDGDGLADFDGGQSIHGACLAGTCPAGVSDPNGDGVADPDPQCVGRPWRDSERRSGCGLGFELVPCLAPLLARRRRRGPRLTSV
jgi:hypothetical protein